MTNEGPFFKEIAGLSGVLCWEKVRPDHFRFRSTAVRLTGGGWLVVSPSQGLPEEGHLELLQQGPVAFLLAPNHFHHMGLKEWKARHPGAVVVASHAGAPRVAKKTGLDIADPNGLQRVLPDHVKWMEPKGLRDGEVWLSVDGEQGPVWFVTDAFFNMPEKVTGLYGLGCRMVGIGEGPCVSRTWNWFHVNDPHKYQKWLLERLAAQPPAMVIPAHGGPIAGQDLPSRLAAMVR